MRCTICGVSLPDHARFCGSCGAPLSDASIPAANPAGARSTEPLPPDERTPDVADMPTGPLMLARPPWPADGASVATHPPDVTPPWPAARFARARARAWSRKPWDDAPIHPRAPASKRPSRRGIAPVVAATLTATWRDERAVVVTTAVAAALLVAAYLAWAEDWGAGLLLLGALAVAAGATIAGVMCVRAWRVSRAGWRGAQPRALLLAATLAVLGGMALLLVSPVRFTEARQLEAAGRYDQAATLYARAGERAPDGRDLARALVEDGAARAQRGDFSGAASALRIVADRFPGTPESATARGALAQIELAWGRQLLARGDYAGAAEHLAVVLAGDSGADAAAQARPLLAQALLRRALAAQAHQDYDRAEVDLRDIARRFPNLPEAGQARQVLAAGQTVTGRLMYANGTSVAGATVLLAPRWALDATGHALVTSGRTYTGTTAADGRFIVPGVPPGATYALIWDTGAGETSVIDPTRGAPVYMVSVQPLRPADMGDVIIA